MNNSRLSHRFLSEIVCLFPPDTVIYSFYLAFLDCNFFISRHQRHGAVLSKDRSSSHLLQVRNWAV